MEENWIERLFRKLYTKYRIYYSRKEIKIGLITAIYIYYMIENQEKYNLRLNPMILKEVIPVLIKAGRINNIEEEVLIPIEEQLKLNNYVSNVFRNLKLIKDIIYMHEMFESILEMDRIEVEELVKFINSELEPSEIKEGKSINKIISKIAPKQGIRSVLDNFSGISETIFTTIEDKSIDIQIQDIDEEQCAISTMLLVMLEYKNFSVINADTLTYYDEKKFDLILSIPPLVMDTTQSSQRNYYYKITECNKRDNWGSLAISFDKMERYGKLITLVNTGALTSSRILDKYARRFLIEEGYIKAIIEFPAKMLYGSSVKTSLLVIDKERSKEITLINLDSREGEKYQRRVELRNVEIIPEGIEEIYEIIYKNKKSKMSRKIMREDLLENYELLPSLYIYEEESYQYVDISKLQIERQKLENRLKEIETENEEIMRKIRGGVDNGKY